MDCERCGQTPCICVKAKVSLPPLRTYAPLHGGPFLSQEEFGLDLFEAIKTQSAAVQARKTAALFRKKGKGRKAVEADQAALRLESQLQGLLAKGTIAPDDVRRLLAIA